MWTNGIFIKLFLAISIFLYTDGRTVTCRHCLDSEIITVVPTVAPCCVRHVRQKCGRAAHCDKGLTCRYPYRHAPTGICKVPTAKPCKVNGTVYQHGTKFNLDCRTSCYCENGIYGCSSLCPGELIVPKDVCESPQLVDVPGQCCREWMCEPVAVDEINFCNINSTNWDDCSSDCGGGVSYRESNANSQCVMMKETRFCQKESCSGLRNAIELTKGKHQLRRKHACRATVRSPASYLRIGPCSSVRSFHPRQCGGCLSNDVCCKPIRTATLKVEMKCGSLLVDEENNDIHKILMEYIIPGNDIWDAKEINQYPIDTSKNRLKRKSKRSAVSKHQANINLGIEENTRDQKNYYDTMNFDPYDDENNIHFINMEWIIKCQCKREYCIKIDENDDMEENVYDIIPEINESVEDKEEHNVDVEGEPNEHNDKYDVEVKEHNDKYEGEPIKHDNGEGKRNEHEFEKEGNINTEGTLPDEKVVKDEIETENTPEDIESSVYGEDFSGYYDRSKYMQVLDENGDVILRRVHRTARRAMGTSDQY